MSEELTKSDVNKIQEEIEYRKLVVRPEAIEAVKEKPEVAQVVEVGPGTSDVKMEVKKGDKVLISKYSGTNVKLEGEEYIIVKMEDILAVVD